MSNERHSRPLPTFAARETFFGTANTSPNAAISLAGVPFDIATTNRAGARDGPAAIRRASRMCGGAYPDNWADMYDLDFADVGNFGVLMGELHESLKMVEEQAAEHEHLIAFGGDHLITLPLLRAAHRKHGPLGLVHFDAHVDTWEENYLAPVTHGTNFRTAINEGLIDPKRMVQIGIRCRVDREIWDWTLDQGVTIITAEDVHMSTPEKIAERIKHVVGVADHGSDSAGKTYMTFDIDGLDPSCAPGTGTPETGGLFAWQARAIITRLHGVNFIGMDVVEVAPAYDVGEITALNGASIAAFYMSLLAARKE